MGELNLPTENQELIPIWEYLTNREESPSYHGPSGKHERILMDVSEFLRMADFCKHCRKVSAWTLVSSLPILIDILCHMRGTDALNGILWQLRAAATHLEELFNAA